MWHSVSAKTGVAIRILGLAIAYFAAAKLGLSLTFEAAQVTAVWPPTGIALAAVLLMGYRVWPGIFLGAFLANITTNEPAATAAGIALGNTLEAVAGAWMLRRAGFDTQLRRQRDVLSLFVFSAALSTMISATIGVASLCFGGVQPWSAFLPLWRLWWLGDATGAMIFAPLLLVWGNQKASRWRMERMLEAAALMTGLVATSIIIFAPAMNVDNVGGVYKYIIFPFIVWAALRLGQRGITLAVVTASAVAIWGVVQSAHSLDMGLVQQNLQVLQFFMLILAITGLLLASAINESAEAGKAKANLAAIVESSRDAIIGKDMHGRINSWNASAERLFGYTAAEAIGQPVSMLIPQELQERERRNTEELLLGGEHIEPYETVRLAKDGRRIDVSVTISPTRDVGGNIIGSSKIMRDISERKWADALLRESEERFRKMADTAPVLIWMSGTDEQCTYFNKPWLDFTGRTLEQEAGEGWMEGMHPDDREHCMAIYAAAFSLRQPFEMEYRLRRNDGEYRWIMECGTPRFTSRDEFAGYIGSCIDITVRKQAEEELRIANHRKDDFLATLSHELRNPLAPIINAARILQLPGTDARKRQEAHEIIIRQTQHMSHLVEDLLDVSRISHGKVELRKRPLLLTEAIDSAVEAVRPLIQMHQHALTVLPSAAPLWVDADPTRLSQIFANLLGNAAKYTPPGGQIRLEVQADSTTVTVRIRDTGIGIPPTMVRKIFEPFTQVDAALERSQGGLGIGLALVRNLIEMHGGSVAAASEGTGRGSEFTVRLPRVMPQQAAANVSPATKSTGAGKFRILVVDDSETLTKTFTWMLEAMGHEVRFANDGESAHAIALEFIPDVLMLDIGLPKISGYDLCRALRQEPKLAHSVFIAQTGWGQTEHRERSKAAGFDHHLVKPVDIAVLEHLLQSLTTQRDAA